MSKELVGRPTWIEVSLGAVVHNFQVARRAAGAAVQVWPVVKADGYGLGAAPIAMALQRAGAPGFCVAMAEEAEILRVAGITVPLVLLSSAAPGKEAGLVEQGFVPVVYTLEDARRLAAMQQRHHPLPIHVKVDTGMGRLGFLPDELPAVLTALSLMPGIRVVGVVSHLACADEPWRPVTGEQVACFQEILQRAGSRVAGLTLSLANSAGLLRHPASHYHWVRPGIMLYGANPFHPQGSAAALGLRPVVTWRSRIIQVRSVAAGVPLGYGHSHVTTAPARMAVVAVGYADGFSRRLGWRAQVLVAGQMAPVVGRVCMDLITVEVTHIPEAGVGSPVTLLGRDGAAEITVEEMATWMETIPYEIYCRLGQRMPKYYLAEGT